MQNNPDDRADRIEILKNVDTITADHKVLDEDQESRLHHRHVVVVQDLATQWIQSYPSKTKSAKETHRSLSTILTSRRKSKIHLYGQNSGSYLSLRS